MKKNKSGLDAFVLDDWSKFENNKIKAIRLFNIYQSNIPNSLPNQTRALKIDLDHKNPNLDHFYGPELDRIKSYQTAKSIIGLYWIYIGSHWITIEDECYQSLLNIGKQKRPSLWFNEKLDPILNHFKIKKIY